MANIRKCIICGELYEYCIHCGDQKKEEPWRYIYHDEKCMNIAHILRSYRGKEFSDRDAKMLLDKYPKNVEKALQNDSALAKEIQKIYNFKKVDKVDKVPEQETPAVEEVKADQGIQIVEEPKAVEEPQIVEEQNVADKPTRKSSGSKSKK